MKLHSEMFGMCGWGGELKKLAIDIFVISFGLIVSSFGTALFYAASLGSSPMATFSDGLHNILNISYGSANTLANAVLLISLLFIKRKYINVGTILCVFTIGPFVNIFGNMLENLSIYEGAFLLRIICVLAGTIMMGLGIGLYVAVERGYGPLEALVKLLCQSKGLSYTKAKMIQDAILVVCGILLKAKWGVGTLIAVFLTGPILQWSIKFFTSKLNNYRQIKEI
ncbi:MAG: YitT family protein [Lutisporaceae bacterium]